ADGPRAASALRQGRPRARIGLRRCPAVTQIRPREPGRASCLCDPGGRVRVLVIDDDSDVRQMVGRFLERRGHTVEVRPGALGLPSRVGDWWRGAPAPDAIVLDMMMPAMSGDAALKLLARNKTSRKIPVVLYSAVERS